MKVIIGSDKSGFVLKEAVKAHLIEAGHEIVEVGTTDINTPVPFFKTAPLAVEKIREGAGEKAILICGTGMGMSQVANKYPGIRAACVESVYAARMCRSINDSNVLCMGGWVIADIMGIEMADVFLGTEFTQGLEAWRQEFLKNARIEFDKLEKEIYGQ